MSKEFTAEAVISERTRLDVKTVALFVGGVLSLVGAMARSEVAMVRMDADLKARIEAVRSEVRGEHAREASDQNTRIFAIENKLASIQATNCAIARKLDVPTVGCRRDEDR